MSAPIIHHQLYAFSYYDPIRKRWLRARYKATVENIRARHAEFRLEGEPEIREGPLDHRIDPNGPHGA
jgi:hypothetical protein